MCISILSFGLPLSPMKRSIFTSHFNRPWLTLVW
jgi:hypothetical protein